jgi:TfoX/Sxy family transcriptional regulator of competence genes
MEMPKSPPELIALFGELAPSGPGVEQRKMFGYPAAFVNGNMFAGLHGPSLVLRLPKDDLQELVAAGGAQFEPMPGRPMTGYAIAPESLLTDKPALSAWLDRALQGAAALPPKEKKPKAAKRK